MIFSTILSKSSNFIISHLVKYKNNTPWINNSFALIHSKIDRSKVPVLDEADLEEQFVNGSGPGGQKLNKTHNCVVLRHKPTGIIIKNQETRDLEQNRKLARKYLITKLDNLINKDESVAAQKAALLKEARIKSSKKAENLRQLKKNLKESIKAKDV